MDKVEFQLISQKLANRIDSFLMPLQEGAKFSLVWPGHSRWPLLSLSDVDHQKISKSAFDVISMMTLAHLYIQARDECFTNLMKNRHYMTLSKAGEESSHSILAIKAYLPNGKNNAPIYTITRNPDNLASFLEKII